MCSTFSADQCTDLFFQFHGRCDGTPVLIIFFLQCRSFRLHCQHRRNQGIGGYCCKNSQHHCLYDYDSCYCSAYSGLMVFFVNKQILRRFLFLIQITLQTAEHIFKTHRRISYNDIKGKYGKSAPDPLIQKIQNHFARLQFL